MEEMINYHELALEKQVDLINMIRAKEIEIAMLKGQEDDISIKRKMKEAKLADLKEKVKNVLEEFGIEKVETDVGKIQVQKNPVSVEIVDEKIIPNEYKKIEMVTKVDKKKIADNFKETGEVIDGVEIHADNTRLVIK